jgi:hypothetical protein
MKETWWDQMKPFVELGGIVLLTLYTGFTVAMYFANRDAANAANSSASAAHDTLVASNRPWIDLAVNLKSGLTYDSSGASIYVGIVKKNVGHSPAVRVVEVAEFVQQPANPWTELRRVCDQATAQSALPSNQFVTQTIFQDAPIRELYRFTLPNSEFSKDRLSDSKMPYALMPEVIMCVAYRADFDTIERHTGYVWDLKPFNTQMQAFTLDPTTGDLPMENVRLQKHPFIGPFAD